MVVEGMPPGADASEFEPKKIASFKVNNDQRQQQSTQQQQSRSQQSGGGGGFWNSLLRSKNKDPIHNPNPNLMIKQRKAPIKVEPKVFFANERTFMAWMHIAIILAGTSIAILAFGSGDDNENPDATNYKRLYGLITLPVAVAFIVYAMYQCKSPLIKNILFLVS